MVFGWAENFKSPVRPCTREKFRQLVEDPEVARVCELIAQVRGAFLRGEFKPVSYQDYKRLMTRRLPVITPCATFAGGERWNRNAIPSGLAIFDLDHIKDPRGYYEAKVAPRVGELGIVLAHVTPSLEGLRLIFILPDGMDLRGAQRWMAERLGTRDCDTSVCDYARCSFVVPKSYILYLDEGALFKDRAAELPKVAPAAPGGGENPTNKRSDNMKKSEADGVWIR